MTFPSTWDLVIDDDERYLAAPEQGDRDCPAMLVYLREGDEDAQAEEIERRLNLFDDMLAALEAVDLWVRPEHSEPGGYVPTAAAQRLIAALDRYRRAKAHA